MLEIFASIIFIVSLVIVGVIIKRKIPVLAALPLLELEPKKKNRLSSFSRSVFLQKILSKVRILILKTDNKTSEWLRQLKEKAKENKTKFSENYWDKLKKN